MTEKEQREAVVLAIVDFVTEMAEKWHPDASRDARLGQAVWYLRQAMTRISSLAGDGELT